ncbi:hypothetical protein [Aurantiacibacter rhizosphaerae]|uniref:AcrB/AcrD/AcrF family protein n=1 Tax=Aurantiacibacter rhizosphaerae TaxID=2691582 RepID=A0A844X7Z6_9SPHN|nr:hypothetical protein [Aurantiacibacter rhizosphaerae]MWV26491.1 hypothetical protein [Aurantiacibacter rhizosphaerae]
MGERIFHWHHFVRTVWAVLAVWLAYGLIRLAIQPMLGWEPVGPDDWTRLLQVRNWLDGQGFWDVTQYRMNPPEGFSMHWSRLVDMPLALLALMFGETAAMALVPLVWLLPALLALRAIMLRLQFTPLAMAFGLVILPLFPLLPGNFAPMRIDHHAPQAVLALVCAALLIRTSRWSAVVCGICAAAWVVISLEGLPLVAVLAGLYGLRYWLNRQSLLPWFLGSLAIASAALSLTTRGPVEALYCDILLPGHMITFAAAAVISAIIPFLPWQDRAPVRLAALAGMGAVCLIMAASLLGPCATNPMAELEPVLQTYWHGYIAEGLPIWRQPVSVALMLLWTVAIIAFGWWRARGSGLFRPQGAEPAVSTLYALFALAAGGYSLLVMREGVVAQLLAIPFAALLLAEFLPRARAITAPLPRILATLAAVGLTTPLFASAFAKPLDQKFPVATMAPDVIALRQPGECRYDSLADLPAGLVLAPLDAGPEILGKSNHTIVAASYHRNQRPMADVLSALIGPVENARATIALYDAEYVVICGAAPDVALYRTANADNFANALVSGKVPRWLERLDAASEGPLQVYRVIR